MSRTAHLSSLGEAIRKELLSLLPAMLFFFTAFTLIVLTEDLAVEEYGLKIYHIAGAAVGALLVAKVVLVVDHFPGVDIFQDKPLIYKTLWSTWIYLLVALLFSYLEHLIPSSIRRRSLAAANHHLIAGIVWPRFWAMVIWLAALFFIFAAFQQLARVLGKTQLRRMFLGR